MRTESPNKSEALPTPNPRAIHYSSIADDPSSAHFLDYRFHCVKLFEVNDFFRFIMDHFPLDFFMWSFSLLALTCTTLLEHDFLPINFSCFDIVFELTKLLVETNSSLHFLWVLNSLSSDSETTPLSFLNMVPNFFQLNFFLTHTVPSEFPRKQSNFNSFSHQPRETNFWHHL